MMTSLLTAGSYSTGSPKSPGGTGTRGPTEAIVIQKSMVEYGLEFRSLDHSLKNQ